MYDYYVVFQRAWAQEEMREARLLPCVHAHSINSLYSMHWVDAIAACGRADADMIDIVGTTNNTFLLHYINVGLTLIC